MGWVDQVVVMYLKLKAFREFIAYVIRHIPISITQIKLATYFTRRPTDLLTGFSSQMATSLARFLSRGMYSLFYPFYKLNYYFRLPCLGASTRSYTVQYASDEPNHDRRWNCVMEKERRRNFHHGRRSPRDRKLPGHVFHLR